MDEVRTIFYLRELVDVSDGKARRYEGLFCCMINTQTLFVDWIRYICSGRAQIALALHVGF